MVLRKNQLEQIGLLSFADRLYGFISERVTTTPHPTRQTVRDTVANLNPTAVKAGFASEVDVALYVLTHLFLDGQLGRAPAAAVVADNTLSADEKRYRLGEALADAGIVPFGALEDDPQEDA